MAMILVIPILFAMFGAATTVPTTVHYNTNATWYPEGTSNSWGGQGSGDQWFLWPLIKMGAGDGNGATGRSEAFADTSAIALAVPVSVSSWAKTYKIIQTVDGGYYNTQVTGHFDYDQVDAGIGFSEIKVIFKITDANGNVVGSASQTVRDDYMALGSYYYTGSFTSGTLVWDSVQNAVYFITVEVDTNAYGCSASIGVADAYANGWYQDSQGVWFDSVHLWPYSGGGGCVKDTSEISMADGTLKEAKYLQPGDSILSYDTKNHTMVKGIVISAKETVANSLTCINNGSLEVTQVDQPIYARNGTYQGWVPDPTRLKVGWEIYDPLNNSWILIHSISVVVDHCKVVDVVTTGPNNYIANGMLLDMKTQ